MKIINTGITKPSELTNFERESIYNGLDVCCTLEVFDHISSQLDQHTAKTYAFSRDLQGPVLEMRTRGVLVDRARVSEVLDIYWEQLYKLEEQLTEIVLDGVGMAGFNWRSSADLKALFYDELQIPPVRSKGRVSVDRAAREKLEAYAVARPLIKHLNLMADINKKIGVLRTGIDPDGRIRTSYNIAGTSTGRFSSSSSEFGTGTNLQNIEEILRSILIADPKMKFAKFDAKSGESFCVGAIEWNLFNDSKYLDACETGDPHTAVARICWPELGWTGELIRDKVNAEQPYYRHYTYRFMCKKLGHGSNYGGLPVTLAEQTKLPVGVVRNFQPKYFTAFPAHLQWHKWVENEIWTKGYLVSLTGRKRHFMGRRNDQSTLREAIAYDPQGSLADIVNSAMLNVWHKRTAILMMQDHDAITVMYPEEKEDEIVPQILKQLEYPVQLRGGRTLRIPYDCEVGWNKGHFGAENPDGLKAYTGHDDRSRTPSLGYLDRPFS